MGEQHLLHQPHQPIDPIAIILADAYQLFDAAEPKLFDLATMRAISSCIIRIWETDEEECAYDLSSISTLSSPRLIPLSL